jgi:hypothetical protein
MTLVPFVTTGGSVPGPSRGLSIVRQRASRFDTIRTLVSRFDKGEVDARKEKASAAPRVNNMFVRKWRG